MDDGQLLTTEDVAAKIKVKPDVLKKWRHLSRGPRYLKYGRMVRYRLTDVLDWERQTFDPVVPKYQ